MDGVRADDIQVFRVRYQLSHSTTERGCTMITAQEYIYTLQICYRDTGSWIHYSNKSHPLILDQALLEFTRESKLQTR